MVDTSTIRLEAVITILDYDLLERLTDTLKSCDMPIALLTPGHGSAKSAIYDILGYGGPKKIVSISLHTKKMTNRFIKQLNKNIDLNKPGTGISCTVSLSSISSTLASIIQKSDENTQMGSEEMTEIPSEQFHLIVSIVNTGFFEQVMEVANKAGATGGTMIHARGLGSQDAIKYLGITIQPEKDVVLILAPETKKKDIMENIIKELGLKTDGNGLCFSLPANNISGFGTGIEKIETE